MQEWIKGGHYSLIHGVHAVLAEQDFHQFEGKFKGCARASAGYNIAVNHDSLFGIINTFS